MSTKGAGHRPVVRRRPSPTQGRALEALGHAIEYLMDSYLLTAAGGGEESDREAMCILKRLNLEIFQECPEVVPLWRRLWNAGRKFALLPESLSGWSGGRSTQRPDEKVLRSGYAERHNVD